MKHTPSPDQNPQSKIDQAFPKQKTLDSRSWWIRRQKPIIIIGATVALIIAISYLYVFIQANRIYQETLTW